MLEGVAGDQPASRRALQEAFLNEERLDDLLDRVARLRQRGGERLHADRPAAVVLGDGREIAAVHGVEARGVDLELQQRLVGELAIDPLDLADMGEVANAAKEPPGDARRAAR